MLGTTALFLWPGKAYALYKIGPFETSSIYMYVVIGTISMGVLLPSLDLGTAKIVLILNCIVLTMAAETDGEHDVLDPLKYCICGFIGLLCAAIAHMLPFPGSRAINLAKSYIVEAQSCLAGAAATLCRAYELERHNKTRLLAHGEFLLSMCREAKKSAAKHIPDAVLEESTLKKSKGFFMPYQRMIDEQDSVSVALNKRIEVLTSLSQSLRGIVLGLKAIDRQEGLSQVNKLKPRLHSMRQGAFATWSADTDKTTAELATEMADTKAENSKPNFLSKKQRDRNRAPSSDELIGNIHLLIEIFDGLVGPGIASVGDSIARVLFSNSVQFQNCAPDCVECFEPCHQEVLEHDIKALDMALVDSRKRTWYKANTEAYLIWGPPLGRSLVIECIFQAGYALKENAQAGTAPVPEPSEKPAAQEAETSKGSPWLVTQIAGVTEVFKTERETWIYALKLTAAILIALWLGEMVTGSGLWAGAAVCFVGPRNLADSAGSYRLASLRLQGTVVGGMAGAVILLTIDTEKVGLLHYTAMTFWVFICAFWNISQTTAYGAFVAMLTPYFLAQSPVAAAADVETWVFHRIEQNVIGVLVYMAVEMLVYPSQAFDLFQKELASTLRELIKSMAVLMREEMSNTCSKCREDAATDAFEILQGLQSRLDRLKKLLDETRLEPFWIFRPGIPLGRVEIMLEEDMDHLKTNLGLMQVVLKRWSDQDEGATRDLQHIFKALQPSLTRLQRKTAIWFNCLAAELESSALSADLHSETAAAASAAEQALDAFENQHSSICANLITLSQLREDGTIPSNQAVLPIHTIVFCTRSIFEATRSLANCVRQICIAHGTKRLNEAIDHIEVDFLKQTASHLRLAESSRNVPLYDRSPSDPLETVELGSLEDMDPTSSVCVLCGGAM
mmetsp:Transcript_38250/g.59691  ORF Transcript_38250/g.59691 Transcript_38250/m.59691 type:complete len:903 (+) Transcript_38250:1160-3868(+)